MDRKVEQAIAILKLYKEVGVQNQVELEEALNTLLTFAESALERETCPECKGQGQIGVRSQATCPKCNGTGTLSREAVSEQEIEELVFLNLPAKMGNDNTMLHLPKEVMRDIAKNIAHALSEKFAKPKEEGVSFEQMKELSHILSQLKMGFMEHAEAMTKVLELIAIHEATKKGEGK